MNKREPQLFREGEAAEEGSGVARMNDLGNALGQPRASGEEQAIHHPRLSAQVRWQIRVAGYALMAIATFGSLEGLSYVYLRVFQGYDGTHLMNYQFDDYKNIQLTPGYRNTRGIAHNNQGFRRDTDTRREKPDGVYRIFIMGGSTAYGLQSLSRYGQERYSIIRNDQTIDYYLEQYLQQRLGRGKVEVINAAITSHMSHHHLIYLNQSILKYHPDMVVFIDGFNDYYPYEKDFDQFRNYAYQERAHRMMSEPTGEALASYTGWWLFRRSHFIHLAGRSVLPVWQKVTNSRRVRARIDVPDALQNLRVNAQGNFLKMVERIALILRQEKVVPVFTLQPELVFQQSKVLTAMEKNIYHELATEWQENYVEFKNKARPIVTEYLRETTARNGALFFDLTDVFGGMTEDAYTDYCHLTPMGNRRLAEYVGEKILPIVRTNGRAGSGDGPPR
jgi:hypothetical protein